MSDEELYQQWTHRRGHVPPPEGFSDAVMQRVRDCRQGEAGTGRASRHAQWWQRLAIAAAVFLAFGLLAVRLSTFAVCTLLPIEGF
jgi:hypothetical protein